MALLLLMRMNGQAIINGNFESGGTGWSTCILETATAVTYGGVGTSRQAEVDGNFSLAASDDRALCQSIPGFTIGSVYRIAFDATRRGNQTPPPTVTVTLAFDGAALSRVVTRSGGYSMVNEYYDFTATQTTQALTVTPNFEGPYGMIFDNLTLTLISALPIELLYFKAIPGTTLVALSWATASERNNDHFTLERSRDGVDFTQLMTVQGAGNSQSLISYGANDAEPLDGLSYYQLEQTDYDGSSTVSEAVAVEFPGSTTVGITVFPNPAGEGPIWLEVQGAYPQIGLRLSIIDAAGRGIAGSSVILPTNSTRVDLNGAVPLTAGSYTVSLQGAGVWEHAHFIVL
ncbi:MAG: hypothetical protein ABI599_01490 [Flavobacteriales bacterium]